jgi:putative membrane protein
MKAILAGLFSCAVMSLPLMGQATAPATGDQAFVDMAAQIDMTEAHLGQLAAENAASQDVKDFAQMLVTDHTADYNTLTAAATKAGLTVPKGLDAKHDKMVAPFEKLHGKAFDARFSHAMVAGHEEAIKAYTKESTDGQNADIKAYATQTLPTLQKHLTGAQALGKSAKKAPAAAQ